MEAGFGRHGGGSAVRNDRGGRERIPSASFFAGRSLFGPSLFLFYFIFNIFAH